MQWPLAPSRRFPLGLLIDETMSGWIELDGERLPFAIRLEAFTPRIARLTVPRILTGTVSVGDSCPLAAEGILTLYPTGPAYDFSFVLPGRGRVNCLGRKQYRLSALRESLTTCPLTVACDGEECGRAELVYREPLWRFPLSAVRLARRPGLDTGLGEGGNRP